MRRHPRKIVFGLALLWGAILACGIAQPGYTDAYYYFNAGQRLVQRQGLTDAYLWTYFNAPDALPGPSHTYWMPLASLVAAVPMALVGAHFGAAQAAPVLCFAALVTLAHAMGERLGGQQRHARRAALLVACSGFFTPFWTTTDTFALYGLVGAGALSAMGQGAATGSWRWMALSGALCGLAHLTRADGVLLVGVVIAVILWRGTREHGWKMVLAALAAYLLVMAPWFGRNLAVIGTPLPTGGTATIWMRSYDEIANYPAGASLADFWSWGAANILRSRLQAFLNNLGTFVAVETWIVLGPFVLIGLWQRRRHPDVPGVLLYGAALHVVMTFVFALPGYRGGLLHSAAALLPFWAAAGSVGFEEGIAWAARRRRWNRLQAQRVFGAALTFFVIALSAGIFLARRPAWNNNATRYAEIVREVPAGAIVMVNDPAALYYHTGYGGVVVPNGGAEIVRAIAMRYGVTYLVLDANRTVPLNDVFLGRETPAFLRLMRAGGQDTVTLADDWRLFAIVLEE